MKKKVKKYFDRQSVKYDLIFSFPIIKFIKNLEKKSILNSLSLVKNDKFLDAGCGTGFYSIALKNIGCDVVAIDFSPRMIRKVKRWGIEAEIHDLENLNLKRKFDKILCAGVLEFNKNRSRVIKNLKRLLKESGSLVLLIPKLSFLGILYKFYYFIHGIKIKLFTIDEIKKLVRKNGFRIVKIDYPNSLSMIIKTNKSRGQRRNVFFHRNELEPLS